MDNKKLTKKDFDPNSTIPLDTYPPQQRGYIAAKRRYPNKGTRYLRDEDITFDVCPRDGTLLRVRRKFGEPAMLYCPCGYEIKVSEVG